MGDYTWGGGSPWNLYGWTTSDTSTTNDINIFLPRATTPIEKPKPAPLAWLDSRVDEIAAMGREMLEA
jgi:hypothetical protein